MPINEDVLVFDHDLQGRIEVNGAIKQLWERDALANAIKIWVISAEGDIVREPTRGGYLYQWLSKPMNTINIDNVEMAIRDGLNQDFRPLLRIIALQVTPNFEKRFWRIYLETFAPFLNTRSVVDERIKAKV